jgi:Zn finger protein HypA/HybF involved in hydrogenase expression
MNPNEVHNRCEQCEQKRVDINEGRVLRLGNV